MRAGLDVSTRAGGRSTLAAREVVDRAAGAREVLERDVDARPREVLADVLPVLGQLERGADGVRTVRCAPGVAAPNTVSTSSPTGFAERWQ